MQAPEDGFDANDPANVAPTIVWLASANSAEVTGQVFELQGGRIMLSEGWRNGPGVDQPRRWRPSEVGAVVRDLLAQRTPAQPVYGAG
ncbi:short chain dehydrogenase [compost metagenome]